MRNCDLRVDKQFAAQAPRREAYRSRSRLQLLRNHPPPAVAAEAFERPEAGLVGHARRPFDPIAEIDVGQPRAGGPDDMVEDDVGTEPLARVRADVEETVDHRQAVALL